MLDTSLQCHEGSHGFGMPHCVPDAYRTEESGLEGGDIVCGERTLDKCTDGGRTIRQGAQAGI
eukprot:1156732-Pelagomonas_calceolata.AAC.9